MTYATDAFFDRLHHGIAEAENLLQCGEDRFAAVLQKKRDMLREVLRLDVYEAMAEAPKIKKTGEELHKGLGKGEHRLEEYDFSFLPGLAVPLWVLRPQQPNGRWILFCHGHDKHGTKGSFTDFGEGIPYHKFLPLQLAEQGYTVVLPEFVGFGESRRESYREEEHRGCYANATALLAYGLNMAGLRVYEAMAVLNLMESWQAGRPGLYGISGGGLVASYLAALDARPACVAVAGYGNTFRHSILSVYHCVDNFTPGILSVGECPEIIGLAAPMPLLVTTGREDPIFPLAGSLEAIDQIARIYERFGAGDRFEYELFDGVHEASVEKLLPFYQGALA